MQVSKQTVINIITEIVKNNDAIVIKIYNKLENKQISVVHFANTVKNYRLKILTNIKLGKLKKYYQFFPVLELFKTEKLLETSDNLTISGEKKYALSALRNLIKEEKLIPTKKLGNNILWDLVNEEQVKSNYNLKNYQLFLETLKKDKTILDFINSLGGTLQIQNKGDTNFEFEISNLLNVPEEFFSLIQSDDLRNIFYLELINLTEKELEIIFLKKVIDKNLITYLLKKDDFIQIPNILNPNDDERHKGALIVMIDTSGSMLGTSEIIAKYIAILITETLMAQKKKSIIN
ncbi:hypothetical protein NV226_01740 [Mycoplasma iguanae]|uniref:VWA domain-containing protein n=1 Tax=Mycoplasma iguanae TaxID=292461 RepID=A0ABY5R7H7_9MOLU|nr:hypothetical protein [Mycoplasma iguanae]UVD81438.1 hypothetical protein NV226_01740 [Mycoplasma iguanae]